MYAVVVRFQIEPEHTDAFLLMLKENAQTSLAKEIGCHQFDVCTDAARPGEVFLYELYEDRNAFDQHLATAHFRTFNAASADMIAAKEVKTYEQVNR